MIAHGGIVGVVAFVDHRYRQTVLILFGGMQGNAVGFHRQILAADPQPRHMIVFLQSRTYLTAPAAGLQEGGHKRQSQRQYLQLVAADKAP